MGSKVMHVLHVTMTVFLLIFMAIPFVPLVLSSFSAGWTWPEVFPRDMSIRAWNYILSASSGTGTAVGTSLIIALTATCINLFLAVPAADVLARSEFPGKRVIEGLLYAPIIIPPFIAVMGLHTTFIRLGMTESIVGVIFVHLVPTLPYMIRALSVSFSTLGCQWEDQGRMLGAGAMQRFLHIVWPHILPGVIAGSSLSILISLSQYLITFLVGGGQVLTLPLILFPFINGGDPAIGSAYTIVFAGMGAFALWGMDVLLKRYYGKRLTVHV